ncbi:MAG: hypothetical protein IPH20_08785 [Bacteroidales bacterium]|nr:hypothetical protein [Bacteroidales bacterium]
MPVTARDEAVTARNEPASTNIGQLAYSEKLSVFVNALKEQDIILKATKDALSELWVIADKLLKLKADKNWVDLELNNLAKALDELQQNWKSASDQVAYWHANMRWLQSKFPEAEYADITGLCKAADKKGIC